MSWVEGSFRVLLVFFFFDRNHRPWRSPWCFDVSTCPMVASSGFKWSLVCASLGDVPCVALPHPHGHRNCRQFACIFCRVYFIVGHNHKLKIMLWLIWSKYELPICSLVSYQPICIIWEPTIDDRCRFGSHFSMAGEWIIENISSCRIKLISLSFYWFI